MTLLWILLGVIAAAALLGLVITCLASARNSIPRPVNTEKLGKSPFGPYVEEIKERLDWMKQRPCEDIFITAHDGKRLHALYFPCENARCTVVLLHSYRSLVELDFCMVLPFYHAQGCNVLMLDNRSHGKSQGAFIAFGIRERYDMADWAGYLGNRLGKDHPVFLMGMSMGAATVLMSSDLDFQANVRGIIADCGYTSPYAVMASIVKTYAPWMPVKAVLALVAPWFRLLVGIGLRDFSALDAVSRTRYPILLFHGLDDRFVPCEMSRQIYDACAGERKLILVPGAGHCKCYVVDRPRIQSALEDFIEIHLPVKEETV